MVPRAPSLTERFHADQGGYTSVEYALLVAITFVLGMAGIEGTARAASPEPVSVVFQTPAADDAALRAG